MNKGKVPVARTDRPPRATPGRSVATRPGRSKPATVKEESSSPSPSPSPAATALPPSDQTALIRKWGEVELLLRVPLENDQAITSAFQAAKDGLSFVEDITRYSEEMQENRGLLLRWVLPFDASTSISDQSNVDGAGSFAGAGTGSAITPEQESRFSNVIQPAARQRLVEGALAIRKLVRIKLSDEADLQQGIAAIQETSSFFAELHQIAQSTQRSPYQVREDTMKRFGGRISATRRILAVRRAWG